MTPIQSNRLGTSNQFNLDTGHMDLGIENMLVRCAGMVEGERLLIVSEDPALGWYDDKIAAAVKSWAEQHGMPTQVMQVGGPTETIALPRPVTRAMAEQDQVVFFARTGDQDRFHGYSCKRPVIMSYITGTESMASHYASFDYQAFFDLRTSIDRAFQNAERIRVCCPLGTDLEGRVIGDGGETQDVCVKRFPLGINAPIPAAGFRGRVALARFLVSTGSRHYEPSTLRFDDVVLADIEGNRIVGFDGTDTTVARIREHYAMVSNRFGIDQNFVHSWHVGIHPRCAFREGPWVDPDHWGNIIFQNPRILHFHTCGAYPPGEISWMIIDPTIELDGRRLWNRGHMNGAVCPVIGQTFDIWPSLRELFDGPMGDIGLEAC